jgi:broad specificity phosphatase PhoE
VLVRHSVPDIRRDVPAAAWELSEVGAARASTFASRVDPGTATTVFASEEPKAIGTAHALADAWGLRVRAVPGLQEHQRPEAQMLSREQFEARVREMLARPADLVFGAETADAARRRFTMAVMRLVAGSSEDLVVVSHGTVITLFVAAAAGVEPFAFWKSLQMPSAVVLSVPDLAITARIDVAVGSPPPAW